MYPDIITFHTINKIRSSFSSVIFKDYLDLIEKNNTLYIYGLKGIGKPFIIYKVAKMMTMDDKYRTIYVIWSMNI